MRRPGGQGRIRTAVAFAPGLQPGPFNHSGTCPCRTRFPMRALALSKTGAPSPPGTAAKYSGPVHPTQGGGRRPPWVGRRHRASDGQLARAGGSDLADRLPVAIGHRPPGRRLVADRPSADRRPDRGSASGGAMLPRRSRPHGQAQKLSTQLSSQRFSLTSPAKPTPWQPQMTPKRSSARQSFEQQLPSFWYRASAATPLPKDGGQVPPPGSSPPLTAAPRSSPPRHAGSPCSRPGGGWHRWRSPWSATRPAPPPSFLSCVSPRHRP